MFLYCVPGKPNIDRTAASAGLAYAFDESPSMAGHDAGFWQQPSTVWSNLAPPLIRIDEVRQTWKVFDKVAIGYWNDKKPTEESLRRKMMLAGDKVDGWQVPRAISFEYADHQLVSKVHLERYISIDSDDTLIFGDVVEKFQPLMDACESYMGMEHLTAKDELDFIAKALSYNYRISIRELCMLNMLTTTNTTAFLDAIVDVTGLQEMAAAKGEDVKKKATVPGDVDTSTGSRADSPATFQPALTS